MPTKRSSRPSDAPQRSRPRFRLAQGKTGTLFAAIAALIVISLSILQQKSLLELANSVITALVVFWWLGWACAFLFNRLLASAQRRFDESQPRSPGTSQVAHGQGGHEAGLAEGEQASAV